MDGWRGIDAAADRVAPGSLSRAGVQRVQRVPIGLGDKQLSAGNDGRDDPEGAGITTSQQGATPVAIMCAAYEHDGAAAGDDPLCDQRPGAAGV